VVPLTQLDADLASGGLPDLVWITPNLTHDMHDGSVAQGDQWLESFLPRIFEAPAWQENGILLLVWDEGAETAQTGCCGVSGGHVPLIVAQPGGRQGARISSPMTHYGLLASIVDAWQLGPLGHTAEVDEGTAALLRSS